MRDVKTFSIGNAGWVRYEDDDCPPTFLRYLPNEHGRWLLRELFVDASAGEEPITVRGLGRLPLPEIEGNVNKHAKQMVRRFDTKSVLGNSGDGSNLAVMATYFATTFSKAQPDNWLWVAYAADHSPPRKPAPKETPARDTSYRLAGGPVDGITNEFLQNVAAAYWAATERGEAPNVAIQAQVPHYKLTTIRWWVRLARERGFLPAGRRGARG